MAHARPDRIVLVGFMGCGKSTAGPLLAQALGWEFRDMDRELERRLGLSIADVFRRHGEPFFRLEERRLAVELSSVPHLVVAAGGGAFVFSETREALAAGALSCWLRCGLTTILSRVRLDGSRPLAPDRETISALFAEREPSYREADIVVDAEAAPEAVARAIIDALDTAWGQSRPRTSAE